MKGPSMIYARELPGGGFVSIETLDAGAEPSFRGRISVERRADPTRRAGHPPPIVAEVSGPTEAAVFHELYPIAADNVAIARAILRWQAAKSKPAGPAGPLGSSGSSGSSGVSDIPRRRTNDD